MSASVRAIVVTYNRKGPLRECLRALPADATGRRRSSSTTPRPTAPPDQVRAEPNPDVDLVTLAETCGGAGGFHAGMKIAHEGRARWIWLMDDDTLAAAGCAAGAARRPFASAQTASRTSSTRRPSGRTGRACTR